MTAATAIPTPRPSLWSTTREAAGLLELPRLALELRSLLREPRGDGSRVLVLPGFGTDDRATWPLRRFLEGRGYDTRGWGLGPNVAEVPDSIASMGRAVEDAAGERGEPVSLVGWSLGGYIAREVARDLPHAVRRVVTLGSPVIGGPKYTTAAVLAGTRGWDLDEIEAWVEERKDVPLRVPVTAIYSRRDGVVAWRACVDPEGDGPIEHVEVDSTHVGLGFSAEVYRLVARRLALPAESHRTSRS
jgi:pimeloyl-ACP methyl ester carboxylesterase